MSHRRPTSLKGCPPCPVANGRILFLRCPMSLNIRIQAKAEQMLQHEAEFHGVTPTAIGKAALDKLLTTGMLRDFLQGVDVHSYQERKCGRPTKRRAAQ